MAVSGKSVRLVVFYLLCTCCQHHALLFSNFTSGHSVAAVRAPRDHVINTTVTTHDTVVPAVDSLDPASPPLLWSKAKTSWPAMDGFSWSRLPKYKGGVGVGDFFTMRPASSKSRVNNHKSHADREGSTASSANSNESAVPPPSRRLQEPRGAYRWRGKRGGASKPRKPLCSDQRTASLLHGRVECSGLVVVVAAGSALLVLLCTFAGAGLLIRCVHRKRRGEIADTENDERDRPALRQELLRRAAGPRRYSYRKLAAAASNFAESRRIGRGGFGSVYRGYLDEQDRHVAVKMFSATGSLEQGRTEFEAEVKVMSQLRHRNVVQLVGWCDGRMGLLLAYELAPGGSLDRSLYDPERLLTWPERYKIALGLGAAILYLHTECEQCVVHGDIKPSNVMLDASRNAKLGDFGLARLVDHGAEPQTTQVVAGTVGYIDPEFVSDRRRGPESDVYSFGVVLLEIACGSGWAWIILEAKHIRSTRPVHMHRSTAPAHLLCLLAPSAPVDTVGR